MNLHVEGELTFIEVKSCDNEQQKTSLYLWMLKEA